MHISPPDKHGFCSLGVSVDASRAAVQSTKKGYHPGKSPCARTHGNGIVHVDRFDAMVEYMQICRNTSPKNRVKLSCRGKYCAELIEDGATLQMRIGTIPNAVLKSLHNHKDLEIHTEMFSDDIVDAG